jgi:gliding motility-associated-like protein
MKYSPNFFKLTQLRFVLILAILFKGPLMIGQMVNVTIEPIIYHGENIGSTDVIPAGSITFRLYANFTNTDDFLSVVYGDADCALNISSTASIFQSSLGSHLGTGVNPAFFETNPEFEFDSFITIGTANSDEPGTSIYAIEDPGEPWIDDFENGNNLVIDGENGGLWFVLNDSESQNAVAGDDFKVLIAQITTTGEVTASVNIQTFINGDPGNVEESACIVATEDTVLGCTDSTACNFDSLANADDDSCIYPEEFYDCDGNCINDVDGDGICDELEIEGCTDPEACNYNSAATDDDDSCIYPEEFYDCDGNCINDIDNDGICDELEVLGCTDPGACNYDPLATEDDGSCGGGVAAEVISVDASCPDEADGSISLTITSANEPYSISWSNGSDEESLQELEPGSYSYAIVDDIGCQLEGTIIIGAPEQITIDDTTVNPTCPYANDGSINYEVLSGAGVTTSWIFPEGLPGTGPLDMIGEDEYVLEAVDESGCTSEFTFVLTSEDLDCLFIPTGFTPNNDGYNDNWNIQGWQEYPNMQVEVFNRWGQSIFSSSGLYEAPWDGVLDGKPLAMASYYFVIFTELGTEPISGFVSLKY